jgi:lysophospholipase L1-like esterase
VLSKRLLKNKKTKNLSVLNLGLGGNCVLRGGLGPTANSRFERDVLKQEGVKYAIVFEGVNDLGGSRDGEATAKQLIESFQKMIRLAHEKGIKIYGGTIMPIKGNNYYNETREKGRQMVNEWIRTSGEYDGVIDFDAATCDPQQTDRLNPDFLFENDWLHPNASGYQKMGESIDLNLFTR